MNLLNGKDDGYKGMLLREGQYCFIKCIGDIDVHNRMLNVHQRENILYVKIKPINKPVQVSTAWPTVFTASGDIYFDNCKLTFV
jgi:hypothetical protein